MVMNLEMKLAGLEFQLTIRSLSRQTLNLYEVR
jgi:hypothetical protein